MRIDFGSLDASNYLLKKFFLLVQLLSYYPKVQVIDLLARLFDEMDDFLSPVSRIFASC